MPRWLRPLLTLRATPHHIALGASVGVFVAFTPTMGVQMLLAAAIATLLRTSRPAAMIPVWITNPITLVPIYAFTWWVGALLWPSRAAAATTLDGSTPLAIFADTGWSIAALCDAGTAILWPMTVGGVLVGGLLALLTYPAVKRAAERVRGEAVGH